MVKESLAAAATMHQAGVSVEVIDVATIKPLDMDTILASVEKTGRCVVVHEAPLTCGVGAEILARLVENALFSLKAPPERVAGFDTIVPYAKMEKRYIPSEKRITDAIARLMEYS